MHVGYLALGGLTFDAPRYEIVNTSRVLSYVNWWNTVVEAGTFGFDGPCISWLNSCDECVGSERFFTDRAQPFHQRDGYCSPVQFPYAPWYNPAVKASGQFFGVMGVSVSGVEDGIRVATVQQAITGGGVVGRALQRPRELVVRAVAVAATEAGMNWGLAWVRQATYGTGDDCMGDDLWFLDSCPDEAAASEWPACDVPPTTVPDPEAILRPLLRKFVNVRILSGPTVLSIREMPSGGWMAELEFVIVCPDPSKQGEPHRFTVQTGSTPAAFSDPPVPVQTGTNPVLARLGVSTLPAPPTPRTLPTTWTRTQYGLTDTQPPAAERMVYSFTVTATEDYNEVRVMIQDRAGDVLDGFVLPFVLANHPVVIDGQAKTVTVDGDAVVPGYARSVDGGPFKRWVDAHAPDGSEVLVVDYAGTHTAGSLTVEVTGAGRSAA